RNAAFVLQPAPEKEDLLRAADREGGNEQRPASLEGGEDGLLQLLGRRFLGMRPVAVGGLEQQRIGFGRVVGIGEQRALLAAQVAGEEDALAIGANVKECGAE